MLYHKLHGLLILLALIFVDVKSQKLAKGLTKIEKQRILDLHNWFRANLALGINPYISTASNMIALEWDDRLAETAQKWADNCTGWHDTNDGRRVEPFTNVGQNYAGNYGIERAVETWFKEGESYLYNSTGLGECLGAACNQYLQLIWSTTSRVGCGWNVCEERKISMLICNYAPGSHTGYSGMGDPPYLDGNACSDCAEGYPFCLGNALCASKSAVENTETESSCKKMPCLNGAVFDEKNCACVCPPGSEGVLCEAPCKDLSDMCSDLKDEQCAWDAQLYTFMSLNCRVSCGFCGKVLDAFGSANVDNIKTNVRHVDKTGDSDFLKTVMVNKDDCVDRFTEGMCSGWADRGLCNKAVIFMDFHCPKSCKRCQLTREPSVINYGECENIHEDDRECDEWAYYGHCDRSLTWMRIFCSKTCDSCKTYKVGSCENKYGNDAHCNAWAIRGDCETSEYWMKTFCAAACDSCGWIKPPEPLQRSNDTSNNLDENENNKQMDTGNEGKTGSAGNEEAINSDVTDDNRDEPGTVRGGELMTDTEGEESIMNDDSDNMNDKDS